MRNKVKNTYNKITKKKKRILIRFFLSFLFGWFIATLLNSFPFFVQQFQNIKVNIFLQNILLYLSSAQLKLLDFTVEINNNIIRIVGHKGVRLAYGCLSIRHMCFFIGFIIAYYGTWWKKTIYIPIGCGIITLVNSVRISFLTFIQTTNPKDFQQIHDIANIIISITILILMFYWVNKCNSKID